MMSFRKFAKAWISEADPKDKVTVDTGMGSSFSLPQFSISYTYLQHRSVKMASVRWKNQEMSIRNTLSGPNQVKTLM